MTDHLLDMIVEKSLKRGFFTDPTGNSSPFTFDLMPTMLDPLGGTMLADRILNVCAFHDVDAVGCAGANAIPLVAVTTAKSLLTSRPLPGCHVIDGRVSGLDPKGKRVILLHDVTTSGNSLLRAAKTIREAGGSVTTAITVIDHSTWAIGLLAAYDISLLPIFIPEDFT